MRRSAGKSRRDSAGEKRSQSYLSGGIDNLGRKVLALVPYNLAESILDGGVIALDEVAVDKLHRQTRFAYFALQSAPSFVGEKFKVQVTHRRLCCPQWQPCAAWAPACCFCWPGCCLGWSAKRRSELPGWNVWKLGVLFFWHRLWFRSPEKCC
jgi:hypothetical protein